MQHQHNGRLTYSRRKGRFPICFLGLGMLIALLFPPDRSFARSFKVLGFKLDAGPNLRVLVDESAHSNQYRSLRFLELDLTKKRPVEKEWLVSRRKAKKRQRQGLFDIHRNQLRRTEMKVVDEAEAHGYESLRPIDCSRIGPLPVTFFENKVTPFSWHCALEGGGPNKGHIQFKVDEKKTRVFFVDSSTRSAHSIIDVPHLKVESSKRPTVFRVASILKKVFVVPGTRTLVMIVSFTHANKRRNQEREILIWTQLNQKERAYSF